MGDPGERAKRWATSVVVTGLLMAASCTTLLGIDKDYHRDAPGGGAGGACIAPEGSICVKTCSSAEDARCDGYACVRGECLTRCDTDVDCTSKGYCDGTSCTPKKNLREPCGDDSECVGGICENQICCTGRCDLCQDCDVATGACANVAADVEDRETCASPRLCDGKGSCQQVAGDPCGGNVTCRAPLHCVDGYCCVGDCASPCSTCRVAGAEGTCSPIAINDVDDNPVCGGATDPTHACNGAGACALARNQPCTKAIECASGECSGTGTCK